MALGRERGHRARLFAAELERRWNAKLEELEKLRESVVQLEEQTPALSEEQKAEVLALGERLAHVWDSAHCPAETRKKIIRTVIEEVIVTLNGENDELRFIIHWKGGTHTEFRMPKPKSGVGRKTSTEDMEVIRRMAVATAMTRSPGCSTSWGVARPPVSDGTSSAWRRRVNTTGSQDRNAPQRIPKS